MAENVDEEQCDDKSYEEDLEGGEVMNRNKTTEQDYSSSEGETEEIVSEEDEEEALSRLVCCGKKFCEGNKEDRIFTEGQPLAPQGAENHQVRNKEPGESESDDEVSYFESVPERGSEMAMRGDGIEEDEQEREKETKEDLCNSERESMIIEQEEVAVLALCREQKPDNPSVVDAAQANLEFPDISACGDERVTLLGSCVSGPVSQLLCLSSCVSGPVPQLLCLSSCVSDSTRGLYERKLKEAMAKGKPSTPSSDRTYYREEEEVTYEYRTPSCQSDMDCPAKGRIDMTFNSDSRPCMYDTPSTLRNSFVNSAPVNSPDAPKAPKSSRLVPLWLQFVFFLAGAVFLYLVFSMGFFSLVHSTLATMIITTTATTNVRPDTSQLMTIGLSNGSGQGLAFSGDKGAPAQLDPIQAVVVSLVGALGVGKGESDVGGEGRQGLAHGAIGADQAQLEGASGVLLPGGAAVAALVESLYVGEGQLHFGLGLVRPLRNQRRRHAMLVQVEVTEVVTQQNIAGEANSLARREDSVRGQQGEGGH
ncbi:hypothetical protein EYF80_006898 [Liparis tanakae]|uniref:Uncharacterized protein n=1 Tax=Liparis tanakae TaxID=230148 RepID=A0A4Z2IYS8_9TELE|nr:hypothetical protein EYF80_006898 [Liparis tanakae]